MALVALMTSFVCNEAYAYDIEVVNADGVTIYYNYFNEGRELEVTYPSSNPYSGSVVIPEEVTFMNRTRKVTSIGERAFQQCRSLTSVTIPNSVTSIGESAFYNCSNLTSVTIGSGVTSIENEAFGFCYGLTSVHITDLAAWCKISFSYSYTYSNTYSNPLSYAHHLYINNQEITDLVIPDGVTRIGDAAFSECSSLTSVTIPGSVTSIGGAAFYKCRGLTSVTIPGSVTSIGEYNQEIKGVTNVEVIPVSA